MLLKILQNKWRPTFYAVHFLNSVPLFASEKRARKIVTIFLGTFQEKEDNSASGMKAHRSHLYEHHPYVC